LTDLYYRYIEKGINGRQKTYEFKDLQGFLKAPYHPAR
jgi:hypothetical protein